MIVIALADRFISGSWASVIRAMAIETCSGAGFQNAHHDAYHGKQAR
jgi:hypothetical protein